jgi:hypothetical protein
MNFTKFCVMSISVSFKRDFMRRNANKILMKTKSNVGHNFSKCLEIVSLK